MKTFQNNFVKKLPKILIFSITFYNFVWIVWQNNLHSGVACVVCPWYITYSFPIEAFFLLIASYLLFIRRFWSSIISILLSGYFSFIWLWIIFGFVRINGMSVFTEYLQTITFSENPLEIWESQVVIAITIFGFAIYNLIKEISTKTQLQVTT